MSRGRHSRKEPRRRARRHGKIGFSSSQLRGFVKSGYSVRTRRNLVSSSGVVKTGYFKEQLVKNGEDCGEGFNLYDYSRLVVDLEELVKICGRERLQEVKLLEVRQDSSRFVDVGEFDTKRLQRRKCRRATSRSGCKLGLFSRRGEM